MSFDKLSYNALKSEKAIPSFSGGLQKFSTIFLDVRAVSFNPIIDCMSLSSCSNESSEKLSIFISFVFFTTKHPFVPSVIKPIDSPSKSRPIR